MLLLVTTLLSDSLQIRQLLTHVLTSSTCAPCKTTLHTPSKMVPCPQSGVNGWAGALLAPKMYVLINNTAFHWKISATPVPEFPLQHVLNDEGTQGNLIPYTCKEILTITAKHTRAKNYMDTGVKVCRACFNILDTHVSDVYKTTPAGSPPHHWL